MDFLLTRGEFDALKRLTNDTDGISHAAQILSNVSYFKRLNLANRKDD